MQDDHILLIVYTYMLKFMPRDTMHKRGLCRHAVSVWVRVCLSVCLSLCDRRVATPF